VSAAIYARQSRVRDAAYSSCQSQTDMCREFAASKDWSITQVYSDEGYSSETLDRPQMSQLIAAIEMGEVRRLVVYSLDRLTRRMLHFQELLKLFDRYSVTLIETRGINAIEKRLDDPNLVDKIVEDLERKLGVPTSSNSSSDLPESSESIQVP
jgi:DNA invertase Pin-like site-specific DNA recombinase